MKIYSVNDKEFIEYGRVVKHIDFTEIISVVGKRDCPNSVIYVPSDDELESTKAAKELENECFGGLPIQIGYCNGHNDLLNCLEYHFSSEINIMESDTILLLGRMQDVVDGHLDTSTVKAFLVPAGVGVELYSTSLHYAPCGVNGGGFRAIVVLPKGTNYDRPKDAKCPLLWGSNKWLIAHKDTSEAKNGAFVGLDGENIQVK